MTTETQMLFDLDNVDYSFAQMELKYNIHTTIAQLAKYNGLMH